MNPNYGTKSQKRKSNIIKANGNLDNVKSKFILKKIIAHIQEKKFMKIIQYNKHMQHRLNLDNTDYKKVCQVELEIKPLPNHYGKFISVIKGLESHYHIFFNDKKTRKKRNFIKENEKVIIIRVLLDYKIKTFYNLFNGCKCIESISFNFFYIDDIISMKNMFYGCTFLKTINFLSFNTENVTDMSYMFYNCSSLKELNLYNFNTNNVTDMKSMFKECSSLEKLNLSNFNTNKVTDMSNMFYNCSSLKELIISSNFKPKNSAITFNMFEGCPIKVI